VFFENAMRVKLLPMFLITRAIKTTQPK